MTTYFVVRWRDDDIVAALEKRGLEPTDELVSRVRKNIVSNKFFRDTMIEAGWNMINATIENVIDEYDSRKKEEKYEI